MVYILIIPCSKKASVAKSESDVKNTDHLISIISNEDMAKSMGSGVNGVGEKGGLNIWMSQRSVDETLKTGSAREISHEAGHTPMPLLVFFTNNHTQTPH